MVKLSVAIQSPSIAAWIWERRSLLSKSARGCPHHLIDVAEPDEPFTAGEYSRQAREVLRDVSARSMLPIVTGGTGLYLRALIEGLFAGPVRHQELRDDCGYPRRSVEAPGCIAF